VAHRWLQVTEVMADLATFIPTRYKPSHPVETFASKLGAEEDAEKVEDPHRGHGHHAAGTWNRVRGARSPFRRSAPDVRTTCGGRSTARKDSLAWCQERPNELWVGHRNRPNEVLLKDPALMQPAVRRYAAYPAVTPRATLTLL